MRSKESGVVKTLPQIRGEVPGVRRVASGTDIPGFGSPTRERRYAHDPDLRNRRLPIVMPPPGPTLMLNVGDLVFQVSDIGRTYGGIKSHAL